jgi:hypothetical protein
MFSRHFQLSRRTASGKHLSNKNDPSRKEVGEQFANCVSDASVNVFFGQDEDTIVESSGLARVFRAL